MSQYKSYQRYLAAKKSVDDRALNADVWQALAKRLTGSETQNDDVTEGRAFQVLEIGSGIGTMIERLLDYQMLSSCTYTAVDELPANGETTMTRLTNWADLRGWDVERAEDGLSIRLNSSGPNKIHKVNVQLAVMDIFDYLEQAHGLGYFDLVIANAFLDLVDAPAVLQQIHSLMKPGGLLYTSINFDGATILQPEIDPQFDAEIEALYHRTMDERIINGKRSGESRTGRHLFGHLKEAGFQIVAGGSSDWVVFAGMDREAHGEIVNSSGYVEDEAYFLHFIIETMHGALASQPALEKGRFQAWVEERHRQIERGDLTYIAHQLDFLTVKK